MHELLSKRTFVYFLLASILISAALRFYVPASNEFPVNYDSIYHARIGELVTRDGWVPSVDFTLGGRPHLYPPAYHLTLGYASLGTGIPVLELVKWILPLFSLLIGISGYFIASRLRGKETGLIVAALLCTMPFIAMQAYDSPQIIGLFFIPFGIYFFLKGNCWAPGCILALLFVTNYSSALMFLACIFFFSFLKLREGNRWPLIWVGLSTAIGFGIASPWIIATALSSSACLDVSTAVAKLAGNGWWQLALLAPVLLLISFFMMRYVKKRRMRKGIWDDYSLFWTSALVLSSVLFALSIPFPQLHSYDMLLLWGFSLAFMIPEFEFSRETYAIIIAVLLLMCVIVATVPAPAVSSDDLSAINWIKENVPAGKVLANPETSGVINTILLNPKIQTEFDLFLECLPDGESWLEAYSALETTNPTLAEDIIKSHGIDYVLLGERDIYTYSFDVEKFSCMGEEVFRSGNAVIYSFSTFE